MSGHDRRIEQTNHLIDLLIILPRTKWKRQTAVGLELLHEAGNFAAVQRMLQTSPYWLSQYGNVATAALAAAASNPGLATPPTTTPFDIYYRQAAAALQQKHQNASIVTSSASDTLATQSLTPNSAPLYVPPASAQGLGRFNSLYLSSLPPTSMMGPTSGGAPESGLLMPLGSQLHSSARSDREGSECKVKTPSPSCTPDASGAPTPPNAPNFGSGSGQKSA